MINYVGIFIGLSLTVLGVYRVIYRNWEIAGRLAHEWVTVLFGIAFIILGFFTFYHSVTQILKNRDQQKNINKKLGKNQNKR